MAWCISQYALCSCNSTTAVLSLIANCCLQCHLDFSADLSHEQSHAQSASDQLVSLGFHFSSIPPHAVPRFRISVQRAAEAAAGVQFGAVGVCLLHLRFLQARLLRSM